MAVLITLFSMGNVSASAAAKVAALMYHSVTTDSSRWNDYTISPEQLDADIQYFKSCGYIPVSYTHLEYETPSVDEFRSRIENISKKYPYIVMVEDDEIVGYAYAGTFKGRKAYDWSVETTIYVREDKKGGGYGKKLYLERCV